MFKFFVKIFLLMIFCNEICFAEEVVIFHTNDFHARIYKFLSAE